jgi:hypothetical protein
LQASNPGQFDNGESDVAWQRTGNAVYHPGPVCIGTENPQAPLTVGGNISMHGSLLHPSDARLKENIFEVPEQFF